MIEWLHFSSIHISQPLASFSPACLLPHHPQLLFSCQYMEESAWQLSQQDRTGHGQSMLNNKEGSGVVDFKLSVQGGMVVLNMTESERAWLV